MEDKKPEISQVEKVEQHHHKHHKLEDLAANEDEPQTPYHLGWRTLLALVTLSMGNVCAALSNTVRPLRPPLAMFEEMKPDLKV